jgi:hypothetical protein
VCAPPARRQRGFPAARAFDASDLGRILARLELAPCLPACLTLRRWAALLAQYHSLGYGGPLLPLRPSWAINRAALLLLYEQRASEGRAIRHPSDRHHRLWALRGLAIVSAPGVPDLREAWLDPQTSIGDVLAAFRRKRGDDACGDHVED